MYDSTPLGLLGSAVFALLGICFLIFPKTIWSFAKNTVGTHASVTKVPFVGFVNSPNYVLVVRVIGVVSIAIAALLLFASTNK